MPAPCHTAEYEEEDKDKKASNVAWFQHQQALQDAKPPRHDVREFHITSTRALFCRDPNAVLALSEPNARERLGDINYVRIATRRLVRRGRQHALPHDLLHLAAGQLHGAAFRWDAGALLLCAHVDSGRRKRQTPATRDH